LKRTSRRRLLALILTGLLLLASGSIAWASLGDSEPEAARAAQTTPTAVQLQFPTPTATAGPPTDTPTRTPTSQGRPVVEAISNETNVRAAADINAVRLGLIFPGTTYPVIGKSFNWYLIEFPESPTGSAWVYRDVVRLTGDEALIPELTEEEIPAVDPAFVSAQETAQFVSATPGAIATLTAQVQLTPTGVFTPAPGEEGTEALDPDAPRPTFTSPPYTNTPIVIPKAAADASTSPGGLAPIVPILALAALGLMGLLVGLFRRL